MPCHRCDELPCICAKPIPVLPRQREACAGAISLQQFGVELFACIVAFGSRELYRQWQRDYDRNHPSRAPARRTHDLSDMQHHEVAANAEAHRLIARLAPDEQRTLLHRFEDRGAA